VRRLPLHPQPLPDEALSSWLWRLAQAYGLTPDAFIESALNLPEPGQLGSLDAQAPPILIERLAQRTGVSVERVQATTLAGYGELLFEAELSTSTTAQARLKEYVLAFPSLAPPGPRAAAAISIPDPNWRPWVCEDLLGFSARACRGCLATGPTPYLRIYWRAGWMVSCPLHGEMLDPVPLLPNALRKLANPTRRAPRQLLVLDRLTHQAVTQGAVEAPSSEWVSAGVWLRSLRALIDEVLRPSGQLRARAYAAVRHLWRLMDLEFHAGMGAMRIYEGLTVERRELAMTVAALAFEHLTCGLIEPVGDPLHSPFRPPLKRSSSIF
jgi:hypothetical protein